MPEHKDIVSIRRERLRQWIAENCGGNQAKLVEKIGINAGELSGLLRKKHFGEKKARTLEAQIGVSVGWLDEIDKPKNLKIENLPTDLRGQVEWLIANADEEIRVMFAFLVHAAYTKKIATKEDTKKKVA